ncbi:peptide-methionine (S)-S-oxide reductase MsrA [Lewinella sp. 4G2]|uniref:peptide-methionine (S)-S-oxide reductase MsrA n=1 Tax=Lewinella sp. 4G2 TaxID=1803372 RepID=UPI0007B4DCA9|nr:peptide-methionine (S)-S-oxide reductase MsrA [Lewinella sp. 4G2]OAV43176.1 peptide-methionine (S)-S-oxide reductase [Lewinella sp. 4G2]
MKGIQIIFLSLALALSLTACDSSKSATTNKGTTTETSTTATNRSSQPELAGDFTIEELDAKYPGMEKAYLAGGCFWCTEASLDRIQGVADVWSGYAGGPETNPTYRQVASGQTEQAEAIVVYYDPAVIDYSTILDVFFVAHDPTQLNRQGPDVGTQYRSAIFPLNDTQRQLAEAKIKALNESGKFDKPIATTIEDPIKFWVAEGYHQDYYEDDSNPNWGYVTNVSKPKVEKVKKVFRDILKPEFR